MAEGNGKYQVQEEDDDIDGHSFGFNTSPGCEDKQLDSGNVILQASGGFNLSSSLKEDQLANDSKDSVLESTADQREMVDEASTGSQVSVESWITAENEVR